MDFISKPEMWLAPSASKRVEIDLLLGGERNWTVVQEGGNATVQILSSRASIMYRCRQRERGRQGDRGAAYMVPGLFRSAGIG